MALFWDVELTPAEEEEYIRKFAKKIHEYGMDAPAILMLESSKPLVFIGGQMGRLFITPFLAILGDEAGKGGEKFLTVFENRENVEKLIKMLEAMTNEDSEVKRKEKKKREESEKGISKQGWRRFYPF